MITLLFCMITAVTVVAVICDRLSIEPYNEIKKGFADDGTSNCAAELYKCDMECTYGQIYCCTSCAQNKECESVCEDYDKECDVRRLVDEKK